MALEVPRPQITKKGHAPKIGPTSQYLQFFYLENAKIDDKI